MGSIVCTDEVPVTFQGPKASEKPRLLPHVLDDFAARDPDYIVGITAKSNVDSAIPYSSTTLSVVQLANAVNYVSQWLDNLLGASSDQTIAFIGLQDFRYWVMEVAAIKTGHCLLLPSPRNAPSNTLSLLQATSCQTVLYSGVATPIESHVQMLQSQRPHIKIHSIPSLEMMIAEKAEHYPYSKAYEEAKHDNVLILHTSGSTGCPKPIYINHAYIKRADSEHLTPPVEGRILAHTGTLPGPMYNGSPFFHLSGLVVGYRAIFGGLTVTIAPPTLPSTPQLACDILRSFELKSIVAAPHIVDSIFAEHGEELKGHFKQLENICWFGGKPSLSSPSLPLDI